MVIIVVVVVLGIVLILVFDALGRFIKSLTATGCGVITAYILPDVCGGPCPGTTKCTATATRPYLFFSTQAAACACVAPPAPPPPVGTPPPGGGGGGSGGSGDGG